MSTEPLPDYRLTEFPENRPAPAGPEQLELIARVSRVAHELRSPLSTIRIAYELLSDAESLESLRRDRDQFRRLIESLGGSIDRMDRQVSDLLDIGYLSAGQVRLNLTSVDPRDVVSWAVAAVSREARSRDQTISITDHGAPATVIVDPSRSRQILLNIILNAISFSPTHSEIRVELRGVRDQTGRDGVQVSVIDQGCGIREEIRERVFDPFFTTGGNEEPRAGGSGLGLTIARELTLLHQGRIWFLSEVGKGTTFHVFLPSGGPG
jgi:signal transduction histidine kinase